MSALSALPAVQRRRMRERRGHWEVDVDELVPAVLVGLCLGLLAVLLANNSKLSSKLEQKEMELLHRESELARANLLWTQMQLAEARGRSDSLGSGEGGRSPPSRSYAPTTNVGQPASWEGDATHPQGGARQDTCPPPPGAGGARCRFDGINSCWP